MFVIYSFNFSFTSHDIEKQKHNPVLTFLRNSSNNLDTLLITIIHFPKLAVRSQARDVRDFQVKVTLQIKVKYETFTRIRCLYMINVT